MPLYEYKCTECGLRFERRQHFSEAPIKICPECGGDVIRLIQPAGIIFKGSGFYVTDNRAKSSTALPGSRQPADKTAAGTSSSTDASADSTSSTDSSSSTSSNSTPKTRASK